MIKSCLSFVCSLGHFAVLFSFVCFFVVCFACFLFVCFDCFKELRHTVCASWKTQSIFFQFRCLLIFSILNHPCSLITVAHNCHGNNNYLTAKPKMSRRNQIPHGNNKFLTAKPKCLRQNQKAHGKIKKLTAKAKSSRQKQKLTAKAKAHGKSKNTRGKSKKLTAKPKPEKGVLGSNCVRKGCWG